MGEINKTLPETDGSYLPLAQNNPHAKWHMHSRVVLIKVKIIVFIAWG